MFGYSIKRFTKSEKWITIVLAIFLSSFLIPYLVNGKIEIQSFNFLLYTSVVLSVSFLFPKIYYHINIDFGNSLLAIIWLVLTGALYSVSEINLTFRIPLFLYAYLHIMRVIYFLCTDQSPSYLAHKTFIGSLDKQLKRKVSKSDLTFMIIHAAIPMVVVVFYIWWKEVYG